MENALQNSMQSSNLDDYMIQKRIEIMMDMTNKKIVSELNNINLKVTKLNEEVIELRKKISEGVQTKPSVILESENKENQADLKIRKNSEQASKPRYGDYTPEDVKIDKFFYFGNKK